MASPPAMYLWKVPATRSVRTAVPSLETTALILANFVPVTLWSRDTTTWLVLVSIAHGVPGMRADLSRGGPAALRVAAEAGAADGAACVAGATSRVPVASVPTATA